MNHNGTDTAPAFVLPDLIFPGVRLNDDDYAKLRMRFDMYDDTILATRYGDGVPGATYAVDPDDVAAALSGLPVRTGFLPEGVLFWSKTGGAERLAVYLPPKVWPVSVQGYKRTWRVPLPGLVFAGYQTSYSIYAVKERPSGPDASLYRAPVPNMSGSVCRGNAPFPVAGAASMPQAVAAFFESGFNNHLANGKSKKYPDSILEMWRVLNRAKAQTYPLDDLQRAGLTLAGLMEEK